MSKTQDEQVLEKLDQILHVLCMQLAVDEKLTMTEKARNLKLAGIDNQTIAEVLNTTVKTIRSITSNLRNKS
jgi:hypothetical protein